jgi:phytoene dehydrogenase-like protein
MAGAIAARVRSRHLRDLLMRHATYNGSDPRQAPATLCCIAHVDLALGGLGVRGGIAALVRALVRVAERFGVRFEYGAWVERIEGRGVWVGGRRVGADAVVVNPDVAHLRQSLRPRKRAPQVAGPPSTSAWNAILRAERGEPRVAHTVLFPTDYEREFADLFDHERPPREPTVYLCAQSVAHARSGWPDAEPVFVMVNAPAEPVRARSRAQAWDEVEARVASRLRGAGLMGPGDRFVRRRTPTEVAARFPGSKRAPDPIDIEQIASVPQAARRSLAW